MRKQFSHCHFPVLPAPRDIAAIARFGGSAYEPSPRGFRTMQVGCTDVFAQTMDFVDLETDIRKAAPPILIGPRHATPSAISFVEDLKPRLTAVCAIDAAVGDDDGPHAVLKGIITALGFGFELSKSAERDFECWRACAGDLSTWHRWAIGPRRLHA